LVCPAHKRRAFPWERQTLRNFLHALAPLPVHIVRGNHDELGDLAHLGDIPHVTVHETGTVSLVETSAGQLVLAAVPYLDEQVWAIGEDVPVGERHVRLEQTVTDWLAANREVIPRLGIPLVAAYHGDVVGSMVRMGQPSMGSEPRLSLEAFTGYDLVCASHIHFAQTLDLPTGGAFVYAGSPWPHSFGEEGQGGKGPAIHTWDGRGFTTTWCRLSYAPLLTLDLEYRGEDGEAARLCWPTGEAYMGPADLANLAASLVAGAHVRLRVTLPSSALPTLHREGLRTDFLAAGAASVKVTPKPIAEQRGRVTAVRAHERAPVFEQLEVMWRETRSEPDDSDRAAMRDILTALEAAAAA
jgi:hypothetical protein